LTDGINQYVEEVRDNKFPLDKHSYHSKELKRSFYSKKGPRKF